MSFSLVLTVSRYLKQALASCFSKEKNDHSTSQEKKRILGGYKVKFGWSCPETARILRHVIYCASCVLCSAETSRNVLL